MSSDDVLTQPTDGGGLWTTHARHDPGHCLCPGLFRALKRGERRQMKLQISYQHGSDSIEIVGPEPLGADDLRVLQGLIAVSALDPIRLGSEPKTQAGLELRAAMRAVGGDPVVGDAVVARCSYRRLAREIGLDPDSGSSYRLIRQCIERLFSVSIFVQRGSRREGFRVLSHCGSDENGFLVALNPRISRAVMGGRHTRIPMSEVRALDSDAARLLHQRLCALVDPGAKRRLGVDTLCSYIWPDHSDGRTDTRKRHRQRCRRALTEIADSAGWRCTEEGAGRWLVERPRVPA